MQAVRAAPNDSLLTRFLRGWQEFETAIERQPIDDLERRVAELERRIADLAAAARAARAPVGTEV